MKRTVDETNPVLKSGVVNIPGVQQQYGQNFGKSAIPFRPPPSVFTTPMGHR